MNARSWLGLATGVLLASLIACGGGPPPSADLYGTPEEPWLYGGEDVWIPIVDGLGTSFVNASRALDAERPADAAAALRTGAGFLEAEAEKAPPEGRARLKLAAGKLTELADRLDVGAPVTRQVFDLAIREAYSADVDCRWPTVADADWMPVLSRIHSHLESARELLVANRSQELATELRKAAAVLRLEAGRFTGDERKAVEAAWFELRQLAAKAQVGTLTDVRALDRGAAHACQTLARAHQTAAEQQWAESRPAEAGALLELAVREYERALVWLGSEDEPGRTAAAEAARKLASSMTATPAPTQAEAEKVLHDFDLAITSLGERLQPARPS